MATLYKRACKSHFKLPFCCDTKYT